MRVRTVAVAPLVALALAACSGDPGAGAQPLPPAPSSTTASPPSPPSPIPEPSAAASATPQGAAQFARFYLEVLNRATMSGDTSQLTLLSLAACNVCRGLGEQIEQSVSKGEQREGEEYQVRFAEATQSKPGDAIVDVIYDQAAAVIKDRAGRTTIRLPAQSKQTLQMRVVRDGQQWRTSGIRFLEAAE